jgi:hypothetical protein
MHDHPCAHRIEFDVAVAGERVPIVGYGARPVAPFPKAAGPPAGLVDVLRIALAEELHQQRATPLLARSQKKMHVVGHQAVGMNCASILTREERQKAEINRAIRVAEEALLAVVAALPDVQSNLRDNNTGRSRHGISTIRDGTS